jgi:hypothetical protein
MSEKIAQFCEGLKFRLSNVELRLVTACASLEAAPKQARETVDEKIALLRESLDRRLRLLEISGQRARREIANAVTAGKARASEWKNQGNHDRLLRFADDAETYAAVVVADATAAIEEAELASLEALVARQMAVDTAGPPPKAP